MQMHAIQMRVFEKLNRETRALCVLSPCSLVDQNADEIGTSRNTTSLHSVMACMNSSNSNQSTKPTTVQAFTVVTDKQKRIIQYLILLNEVSLK